MTIPTIHAMKALLCLGTTIAGILAGLMIAAVVTYLMPRKYESTVLIEVRDTRSRVLVCFTESDPYRFSHISKTIEEIKSDALLDEVAKKLSLPEKWNRSGEETVAELRKRITIRNMKGTDLFSVKVVHTDREQTREIATALVEEYQARKDARNREISEEELAKLKKAVEEQEKVVEEKRKLMSTAARPYQDPEEMKKNFETEQMELEHLKLKKIATEITMKIPPASVNIHEIPVIGEAPVSPNVMRNLMLGTGTGFFIGLLAGILLAIRVGRSHPTFSPEEKSGNT